MLWWRHIGSVSLRVHRTCWTFKTVCPLPNRQSISIIPLLLLLLLLLCERIVPRLLRREMLRIRVRMPIINRTFITPRRELLWISTIQRMNRIRANLALKTRGWRSTTTTTAAAAAMLITRTFQQGDGSLGARLPANFLLLLRLLLRREAAGYEMEWCSAAVCGRWWVLGEVGRVVGWWL